MMITLVNARLQHVYSYLVSDFFLCDSLSVMSNCVCSSCLLFISRHILEDPSNDLALVELEQQRRSGVVSSSALIPLLANHIEWINSQILLNEDDENENNYVKRVWDLMNDVCASVFEEENSSDDSSEQGDNHRKNKRKPLTLHDMLYIYRPETHYKPCWYRSNMPNAELIVNLPLNWNVEYRMLEGRTAHRPDKATAEYRVTSHVECVTTDPTTGITYDIKNVTGKIYNTNEAATDGSSNRNKLNSSSSSSSSNNSNGFFIGIVNAVPLKERKWWLTSYGKEKLRSNVMKILMEEDS
jgi:hypothetical protein